MSQRTDPGNGTFWSSVAPGKRGMGWGARKSNVVMGPVVQSSTQAREFVFKIQLILESH